MSYAHRARRATVALCLVLRRAAPLLARQTSSRSMSALHNVVAPSGADEAQRAAFEGGNICVLDQLAAGEALDASLGFCESCLVELRQRENGTVSVAAATSASCASIPLAHQFERGAAAQCPARCAPSPSDRVRADARAAPALLLGACVLVVRRGDDGADRVLLTRRSPFMRTFPRAWVPPGGGVDPGERSAAAAAREVREETGLEVDEAALVPLCAWESAFPESVVRCADGLRRHHLVVYYVARLPRGARVGCPRGADAEVDAAVWLRLPPAPAPCHGADAVFDALGLEAGAAVDARAPDGGPVDVVADDLRGIWPQARGGGGVTRGALFALATLAARGTGC